MSMGILAIAGITAGVGGALYKGVTGFTAAKDEAKALEREAELARVEEEEEAARLAKEHAIFLAKQSLMFLKGGVTLEGSPLWVLEETREEGKKQVAAKENRALARYNLGMDRAGRMLSEGRAKLIGGIFDATSIGTSLGMQFP